MKILKKVLEFDEDDFEAVYYVGLGYFYLANYEEAIKNFGLGFIFNRKNRRRIYCRYLLL
ncbi:hypothetical protein OGZ02_13790 [Brachyspira hyodysenteriae]|nr:hypothetical protein [Brachyspira hyodysenteriae]MDA1469872.1 hypothetical protein [Brachyspira hyodysenteriae]